MQCMHHRSIILYCSNKEKATPVIDNTKRTKSERNTPLLVVLCCSLSIRYSKQTIQMSSPIQVSLQKSHQIVGCFGVNPVAGTPDRCKHVVGKVRRNGVHVRVSDKARLSAVDYEDVALVGSRRRCCCCCCCCCHCCRCCRQIESGNLLEFLDHRRDRDLPFVVPAVEIGQDESPQRGIRNRLSEREIDVALCGLPFRFAFLNHGVDGTEDVLDGPPVRVFLACISHRGNVQNHQPLDVFRIQQGERLCYLAAHRVADQYRFFHVLGFQKIHHVLGHAWVRHFVGPRLCFTVVPKVDTHDFSFFLELDGKHLCTSGKVPFASQQAVKKEHGGWWFRGCFAVVTVAVFWIKEFDPFQRYYSFVLFRNGGG
mmetsp:Transcript_5129/g.10758  ORF Transcript_5129/g.10758 Transcript_5129/m.10758 type:complete len:369 (-) Transcript_5129:717-1823(-)